MESTVNDVLGAAPSGEETRQVEHELSIDERIARLNELREARANLAKLAGEEAVMKADFKKRYQDAKTEHDRIEQACLTGKEMRPIPCEHRTDLTRGLLETVRKDNGTVITSRPLTEVELANARQGQLPFEGEAASPREQVRYGVSTDGKQYALGPADASKLERAMGKGKTHTVKIDGAKVVFTHFLGQPSPRGEPLPVAPAPAAPVAAGKKGQAKDGVWHPLSAEQVDAVLRNRTSNASTFVSIAGKTVEIVRLEGETETQLDPAAAAEGDEDFGDFGDEDDAEDTGAKVLAKLSDEVRESLDKPEPAKGGRTRKTSTGQHLSAVR